MSNEYRSNESRPHSSERSQRPGRNFDTSYNSKNSGDESWRSASDNRDYSDSNMGDRSLNDRGQRDTNAPLEWDSRRYGRDFNDDNTDGGRGIYERGSSYNNPSYASEREPYDSGSFQDQRYAATASSYRNQRDQSSGSSAYGQRAQQSAEREGRSNFGSNRYGGSDYGSNDYQSSENRYSTPYSDASSNRVTGSNWNRTTGRGEWASRENAGSLGDAYSRSSGQAYDQVYGRESRDSNRDASYRGKGPKDYKRSDDRLKEIACELLMDAPHIDASDITVEAKNGEITLKGTVSDRRAKHAAEDLLEGRAGVTEIHNQLRIQSRSEGTSSGWESARQSGTTDSQRQDLSPNSNLSTSSVSNSSNTGSSKDRQDNGNKGSDKTK